MHRLTRNCTGRAFPSQARIAIFFLTLIFYGFKEPWWLIPFVICIGFDFLWASQIHCAESIQSRKLWLILSVSQNIFLLAFFKYRSFILENMALLGVHLPVPVIQIEGKELGLPAGISFYTFESLSFVIDVYRREITPPKSVSEFFGFIGMFPRFVAGPIVRYRNMVSQFKSFRGMQVESGLFLFIYGLFLKVVFADNFSVFTQYAFGRTSWDFLGAWIGALAYTFHMYFDCSGYSLMAIGLGKALGFQFPTNFNRPYLAVGAQDFWRRWHMSLSTWLRDYLYISLGGSRRGRVRTYVNLFLTMLIGGLWHGAQWHFVLWGTFHGVWLALERMLGIEKWMPRSVHWITTFIVIVTGWVIFRSENGLGEIRGIMAAMFCPTNFSFNTEGLRVHPLALVLSGVGIWHCFWFERRLNASALEDLMEISLGKVWAALGMLLTALILGFSERTIPFIYFQF